MIRPTLRLVAAAAIALALAAPARAGGVYPVTVGTSAANTSVPAPSNGTGYRLFVLDNENATVTDLVACTFDGTAALHHAGSFTVTPGAPLVLHIDSGFINFSTLNCIATVASSPLTVLAY